MHVMATTLMVDNRGRIARTLRIRELERQLEAERDALEPAVPVEPTEENAVIRFSKYGNTYSFAAIKVAQSPDGVHGPCKWFITQDGSRSSRQGHAPKAWGELLSWIGERNWGRIEVLS